MDSSPNFNQKVLDNKYNNDKKPFLASLPVNSAFNLIFICLILTFIIGILIFVKVPTNISSFGKIINKTQLEFIIFNEKSEPYYIESINVKKNEIVKEKNIPIVTLTKFNSVKNNDYLYNSKNQLKELTSEIIYFTRQYDLEIKNVENIITSQKKIISLTNENKENKLEQLKMFSESYKNGYISKEKYDLKLNEISELGIELARLNKEIHLLELKLLKLSKEKQEKISYVKNIMYKIEQDNTISFSKNQVAIYSPCSNCKVTNIMMKKGDLISKKSPILSLQNNTSEKNMYAEIYIEAKKYAHVSKDSIVRIQLDAYPYLKYGTLEGKIEYISESPITLDNGQNVFLAEAKIIQNKKSISLSNGMTFKANIIKDEIPLYKFFTKELL